MTSTGSVRHRLDAETADERRRAIRALLTRPLLPAAHHPDAHRLVRRHAAWLKDWFAHEAGWTLTVDASLARLRKITPTLDDRTRCARARASDPPFSRRRYVLVCLALAYLETADRQTTLGHLAEGILGAVAADPALAEAGIDFDLTSRDQRRDLVATVRLLLDLGVLHRVDGDEVDYVAGHGDVLYNVERAVLATLLTARRPPSTIEAADLTGRLAALVAEPVPDTHDARNRAIRTNLTRRLLDDPVVYHDDLSDEELAYLTRQRHRIVSTIEEATGLAAEVRAEGLAMVDDRGALTDVKMPDQGTDGHLTLLVAEHLAQHLRNGGGPVAATHVEAVVARCVSEHADHWRRDVREPGAEVSLAADAIDRLVALGLARRDDHGITPLPAIARYATAQPTVAGTNRTSLLDATTCDRKDAT
ncbi:MAG: TIGR02678 family protein [Actinobacteria bacterium]|nr:TIGR02678 family protein [Actinomycetota bacterium]